MKKLPFTLLLLVLAFSIATAQDPIETESVTIQKVKRGEVPAVVLTAFEQDFPGGKAIEYSLMPLKTYKSQWVVTPAANNDDFNGMKPDYYDIYCKGSNFVTHAIYNANGKLLKFSEKVTDAALPTSITQSISAGAYKDWVIVGDKEIVNTASKKPDYYRVKLEKGHHHKYLYFDTDGKQLVSKSKV